MGTILFNVLRSSIRRTLRNELINPVLCKSQLRYFSVSTKLCTKAESSTKPSSQKKSKSIQKVTLLQNQAVTVMTLEEAQKLARRRDLKLIKVQELDPKSQRSVYKLATAAELLSEDSDELIEEKSGTTSRIKKPEKSLTIGCRISDNDLASRLKNITKWLNKGIEIRVLIQGGNEDIKNSDNILRKIETTITEPAVIGKITQKRTKDNFIKFNIVPSPSAPTKETANA